MLHAELRYLDGRFRPEAGIATAGLNFPDFLSRIGLAIRRLSYLFQDECYSFLYSWIWVSARLARRLPTKAFLENFNKVLDLRTVEWLNLQLPPLEDSLMSKLQQKIGNISTSSDATGLPNPSIFGGPVSMIPSKVSDDKLNSPDNLPYVRCIFCKYKRRCCRDGNVARTNLG